MKTLKVFVVFVLIGVVAVIFVKYFHSTPAPTGTDTEVLEPGKTRGEVRDQVVAFGNQLKNVSLVAPSAASDIEQQYSPYVSRSLLSTWTSHPNSAPGRQTSSPWPDHIDIIDIERSLANQYDVRGMLVYKTSEDLANGDAGSENLALTVISEEGVWKIDSYTMIRENEPNAPRQENDRPRPE